mmetsp:Transcript_30604/g.70606  ORF Transcript_30604/g.70606 Transcript_30604/m.70606 type:complete len:324 (+) Transcript_30604:356-1327(+)
MAAQALNVDLSFLTNQRIDQGELVVGHVEKHIITPGLFVARKRRSPWIDLRRMLVRRHIAGFWCAEIHTVTPQPRRGCHVAHLASRQEKRLGRSFCRRRRRGRKASAAQEQGARRFQRQFARLAFPLNPLLHLEPRGRPLSFVAFLVSLAANERVAEVDQATGRNHNTGFHPRVLQGHPSACCETGVGRGGLLGFSPILPSHTVLHAFNAGRPALIVQPRGCRRLAEEGMQPQFHGCRAIAGIHPQALPDQVPSHRGHHAPVDSRQLACQQCIRNLLIADVEGHVLGQHEVKTEPTRPNVHPLIPQPTEPQLRRIEKLRSAVC